MQFITVRPVLKGNQRFLAKGYVNCSKTQFSYTENFVSALEQHREKKNSEKIIVKNLFIYGRMDFGFRPKTADMMTMIMFIGKQIRNHGMVAAAHDGNILKITSP